MVKRAIIQTVKTVINKWGKQGIKSAGKDINICRGN